MRTAGSVRGAYSMNRTFSKLPRSIWALGIVSLLMDISSEIVHGLLPVFLVSILGASYSMMGFIEGIGEATALVFKVVSGPLSDCLGKRKPFVVLGYAMGAISKPLFAIAPTPVLILGARLFDRTGKGIRGAPRDALVADATPLEIRGQAFGLRQSLDTVGAFMGPLLAILFMSLTHGNYRLIFWIAAIPGFLAVAVLIFGVQEPEAKKANKQGHPSWRVIREFPPIFWVVVIAGAIFQLARFSEAFLILRAKDLGLSFSLTPIVLVTMNIVYALTAYPLGALSDRMRREWLILSGFLVLIIADFALGFGSNLIHIFVGVLFWGLHLGLTQGVLAALVADASPSRFRGTAYGIFSLFSAVALLLASVIAGILWDQAGPRVTFLASAAFSFGGIIALSLAYGVKPDLFSRAKP